MQAVLSFARVSRVVFMMQFGWMRPWIYGLTLLFRPVTQVLFFGIVARFVTGQTDVGYWVIGNASLACLMSSFYSVASVLHEERSNGTLSLMALAPRSLLYVFAGRIWLVAVHGLVSSAAALAVGVFAFGMDVSKIAWGPFAVALLASVFGTSALGAAVGSLGMYTDAVNIVNNVVASLLLIFSGINYPVSVLPGWLQPVAKLLPMTHGTAAARLAAGLEMTGLGPAAALHFGSLVGREAFVGIGWLAVGWLLFAWATRRARRDGTLDLF